MATQTVQSQVIAGLSFTYDDVTNNLLSYSFDCTDVGVQIPNGITANPQRDESAILALIDELSRQVVGNLNNLDKPLAVDINNDFFENEGFIDRDSGTTDANGNPITERQLYRVTKFLSFYRYDSASIFIPTNAVNNDD